MVINQVVIARSGGTSGVRVNELLESIAVKPQMGFGDIELYPDFWTKSAVLYKAIVNYHVFVDDNKRTSVAALGRFLDLNGYSIELSNRELVDHTVSVATDSTPIEEIAKWVKAHSKVKKL